VETRTRHSPPTIVAVIPEVDRAADVKHLPEDVEAYYKDARRAQDAGIPDAVVVQLRRTLEAAVAKFENEEAQSRRTPALVTRIGRLIDQGLVTAQFAQVLDHVRLLGNIGAHATDERLTYEQVRQALDFTTQVLRNLFEIPAALESLGTDNGDGPPAEAGSG